MLVPGVLARPAGEMGRATRRITAIERGRRGLSKLPDRLIAIASVAISLAIAVACVAQDRQMAGYTGGILRWQRVPTGANTTVRCVSGTI